MKLLIALAIILTTQSVLATPSWWTRFCERNLVAEDPYQYSHLTNDKLIDVYYRHKLTGHKSTAIITEIKSRLMFDVDMARADREILTQIIAGD